MIIIHPPLTTPGGHTTYTEPLAHNVEEDIGKGLGGKLICSTSPSSYNPEWLAPTTQAKPFCNYILEGSVISTVVVCSSLDPLLDTTADLNVPDRIYL